MANALSGMVTMDLLLLLDDDDYISIAILMRASAMPLEIDISNVSSFHLQL
jgi:hypothetical protein